MKGNKGAQTRAAMVAWKLASGQTLMARDVMRMTGLKRRAALQILYNLAEVLPIERIDVFYWRRKKVVR